MKKKGMQDKVKKLRSAISKVLEGIEKQHAPVRDKKHKDPLSGTRASSENSQGAESQNAPSISEVQSRLTTVAQDDWNWLESFSSFLLLSFLLDPLLWLVLPDSTRALLPKSYFDQLVFICCAVASLGFFRVVVFQLILPRTPGSSGRAKSLQLLLSFVSVLLVVLAFLDTLIGVMQAGLIPLLVFFATLLAGLPTILRSLKKWRNNWVQRSRKLEAGKLELERVEHVSLALQKTYFWLSILPLAAFRALSLCTILRYGSEEPLFLLSWSACIAGAYCLRPEKTEFSGPCRRCFKETSRLFGQQGLCLSCSLDEARNAQDDFLKQHAQRSAEKNFTKKVSLRDKLKRALPPGGEGKANVKRDKERPEPDSNR